MAETASFTPAVLTDPGATTFRLASMTISVWPEPLVKITLQQWTNGAYVAGDKRLTVFYRGSEAMDFGESINIANFGSGTNMRTWLMERMVADGKLAHGVLV